MMVTKVPVFLILAAVYFAGCYTVLKPIPPSEQEIENRQVMARPFTADPALLGTWSNTIQVMDAENDVRTLTFYKDGKIYFSSQGHVRNGGQRGGTYRLFQDTLVVFLASSYFTEKYLYSVESDHLILTSLRKDWYEPYALVGYSTIPYVRKKN